MTSVALCGGLHFETDALNPDDSQTLSSRTADPADSRSRAGRGLAVAGVLLVFLALAAAAVRVGSGLYRRAAVASQAAQARRAPLAEAVEAMGSATSPEALEQAVGPDGVVLKTRDGSRIAIRPSPDGGGAVARDGGGEWLESSRPFRLELAHYHDWQGPRGRAKAAGDPDWSEESFLSLGINRQLDAIEQSADLPAARQKMKELGFSEFRP